MLLVLTSGLCFSLCVIHPVLFVGMKKKLTVVRRGEEARICLYEHLGS